MSSVTLVGGVEVSNQSGVPAARFVNWIPPYCVMTLYSGVVPNWLRKACNVWAYTKSGDAALAKLGPQKMKTSRAEMITPPPWSVRLETALGTTASRVGR